MYKDFLSRQEISKRYLELVGEVTGEDLQLLPLNCKKLEIFIVINPVERSCIFSSDIVHHLLIQCVTKDALLAIGLAIRIQLYTGYQPLIIHILSLCKTLVKQKASYKVVLCKRSSSTAMNKINIFTN